VERCKVLIGTGSADVSYMLDQGLMTALSRKEAVIVCVVDGLTDGIVRRDVSRPTLTKVNSRSSILTHRVHVRFQF